MTEECRFSPALFTFTPPLANSAKAALTTSAGMQSRLRRRGYSVNLNQWVSNGNRQRQDSGN